MSTAGFDELIEFLLDKISLRGSEGEDEDFSGGAVLSLNRRSIRVVVKKSIVF